MKASTTRLFCVLLCFLCSIGTFAQSGITVIGTVIDETETPLPGANVIVVKNKKMVRGTTTNIDGKFKLTEGKRIVSAEDDHSGDHNTEK